MDFTHFIPQEMISPLHWLGQREWIEFGDIPEHRQVWGRPKELLFQKNDDKACLSALGESEPEQPWLQKPGVIVVTQEEFKRHDAQLWTGVQQVISWLRHNVTSTFWIYSLSKCLADGAKVFRATTQQCLDLASDEGEMSCDYPFSDFHQPYPVFILELPLDYQIRLQGIFEIDKAPTHVFCHHTPNRMITVSAFFDKNNIITCTTPNRAEYTTLEVALRLSRERRRKAEVVLDERTPHDADFDVSEVVQRLGINFGMWMTFIGTHIKGPLNPNDYARFKHEANSKSHKKERRRANARGKLMASLQQVCFDQVVEFHDEVVEVDARPDGQGGEGRSPRPHRRRAHWRNQACGQKLAERKWIPIKAVIVRKAAFVGDMGQMTTTYTTKTKK